MNVGTLSFRDFHGTSMAVSCTLMGTPLLYSSYCHTNCFGPWKSTAEPAVSLPRHQWFTRLLSHAENNSQLKCTTPNQLSSQWYETGEELVQKIGTDWSNFPPKPDSTEDAKGGFPKIWKEGLVLPSLVAEGKHSCDWINKTTAIIMPWLKALRGRQWLIGMLLLILFSLSRGRMCAEVWDIWISSKWEGYSSFRSNFNVRNKFIFWSVPGF